MNRLAIFSGTAHPALAQAVCDQLSDDGVSLGKATVGRFSDGEVRVQIEQHVRGVDVYVVQPTCAPVNDNLVELLVMVDALRRASAASITAVIPYFGYARQDRKAAPRTPITAKLVADLLGAAHVDRVVSVDLHAPQIQGFFPMLADDLSARPTLLPYLREHHGGAVVVSPDAGGVERARALAKRLGGALAIIDKRRDKPNESEVMHVVGDVSGRKCLILDDMIDTGGTLVHAADALLEHGATDVVACATHGVFSGQAAQRIGASHLSEVVVTDTIPLSAAMRALPFVTVVSVAPLLAEAIRRIHHSDSISSLFM